VIAIILVQRGRIRVLTEDADRTHIRLAEHARVKPSAEETEWIAIVVVCFLVMISQETVTFLRGLEAPSALVLPPEVIKLPSQVLDGPCDILDIIMGD
jgi:hypothetical protein